MINPTPAQVERAYLRAFNASVRLDELEQLEPGSRAQRAVNTAFRRRVAQWHRMRRQVPAERRAAA